VCERERYVRSRFETFEQATSATATFISFFQMSLSFLSMLEGLISKYVEQKSLDIKTTRIKKFDFISNSFLKLDTTIHFSLHDTFAAGNFAITLKH